MLGVEVHCLSLYLFVHLYLREAHRTETADVWPPDLFPALQAQQEPSSPMRLTAAAASQHGGGSGGGGGREQQQQGARLDACCDGV